MTGALKEVDSPIMAFQTGGCDQVRSVVSAEFGSSSQKVPRIMILVQVRSSPVLTLRDPKSVADHGPVKIL